MKKVVWLLIGLACVNALRANEPSQVQVRLRFLGFEEPIKGVGLKGTRGLEELWIPSTYLPEPMEYAGDPRVVLYREGEDGVVPVAQGVVPAGVSEVLFLLFPNPRGGEGQPEFLMQAVNFSPRIFPTGSYYLWNMTPKRLVGQVGNQTFNLPAKASKVFSPGVSAAAALDAKIMYHPDPERISFGSKKWFYNPKFRKVMIFVEDPKDATQYKLKAIRVTK